MRRLIFCLLLATSLRAQTHPVFNIASYGAKADGVTPATESFRRAIAAAKLAGGGTVFVPAGHYTSGPIELISHLHLDFDAGAIVNFPAHLLPFTPGRQQGIETLTPVPLIGGHDLEDVIITGGTLTSNNTDWMALHARKLAKGEDPGSANGDKWEQLLLDLEDHKQIPPPQYEAVAAELRPSFVRFMNSKDVLVDNVHFIGSPMWTVHLLYTTNATVRNVVIETYPGVHTDGIVIDSSRFIHLTDDYIDTGDDGIVIKSGKDADGLRVNRATEDITITGCTVHHAHGAVTIGSETSGSVRNVVASNMTAVDTEAAIRIKSRRGRGGTVSNIRFSNWTMRNVGKAIEITNFYMMEGEKPAADEPVSIRTPHFKDIAINGVTIDGAKILIDIDGLPESPIDGLRITDVAGTGKLGMRAKHASALQIHNVQLNPESGSAFSLTDCPDAELDGISTRKPHGETAVVSVLRSTGVILRNSRAFAGTAVFLADPANAVHFESNVLGDAKITH